MEKKIIDILDNVDVEETERLLDGEMDMEMDPKAMNRIKKSVYEKAGLKAGRKVYFSRKLVACLATLVIIVTSMAIVGFDNVAAAINKIFSFIPGVGIVENNDSIEYVLAEPVSSENNNVILSLNNAVATKDTITVMFTIAKTDYTDEQLYKDKQEEWEQLQKDGGYQERKVYLYAGSEKYTEYSGSTAGGGKQELSTFAYSMKADNINLNTTYKLEYEDYDLSVEFNLESYESFNNLEDIGPTDYHNDISITAVPTFFDGKVEVNLYSVNNSGYLLESYNKHYEGYLKKDLHLETDSGIKSYTTPGGYGGVNGKFVFDIEEADKNFNLKVPYIVVRSDESKKITLKIPKEGEIITLNKEIEFEDSTMTIIDVERTSTQHIGEFGDLKMTIKYDNKSENKIMAGCQFTRTNVFGIKGSGSWSGETNDNDMLTTVYYALEEDEDSKLRLVVEDPVYYITDEYSLSFSKD